MGFFRRACSVGVDTDALRFALTIVSVFNEEAHGTRWSSRSSNLALFYVLNDLQLEIDVPYAVFVHISEIAFHQVFHGWNRATIRQRPELGLKYAC